MRRITSYNVCYTKLLRIRSLVEKTGVPFLPMSMAKGLLPDTHPQCAGAARSTVLKDSDVVMLIGARLNWLLSHGKGKAWGEATKKFIQIDIRITSYNVCYTKLLRCPCRATGAS